MNEAYIVATGRTAGGRRGGRLAGWHPADLAGRVIDTLLDRSGAKPEQIDDVIMGCVSQAGEQSTNIGRNAVLSSCLPDSVPGTSVDRQCGSSQQALHFAAQAVMAGSMDVVIAAGVNIYGGAIALGHPLGATGAKLMTTLVHALRRTGGRYGLQTMCEGGGMANVTIIERL